MSKELGLKVLREGRTLLGLLVIALLSLPFAYWAIVEVDAEPPSTILIGLVSGTAGFVMSQWHIHRMRKWFHDHPTDAKQ